MKAKLIAIASTYFRAAFAAVTALYLAGETSPKALASAALAAVTQSTDYTPSKAVLRHEDP